MKQRDLIKKPEDGGFGFDFFIGGKHRFSRHPFFNLLQISRTGSCLKLTCHK